MKINLVANIFPTPSETFLFNLVTGLEANGVKVTVIAADKSNHHALYKNRIHEWSGKIKIIPTLKRVGFINIVFALLKNIKLFVALKYTTGVKRAINLCVVFDSIIANKPDVVHFAFSGIAIQYQDIIPYLNKVTKTMVSCRGTGEKLMPIIEPKRLLKLEQMLQKVNAIHCVSNDIRNILLNLNINHAKIFINHPAVIPQNFPYHKRKSHPQKQCYHIVTTGRLSFEKGYAYALLACEKLKQAGYSFMYHILGDGPDRNMLEYMINDLHLSDNIILYGKVSNEEVRRVLDQADIFLLPSVYEGISNAALEAMSGGVPIVTTMAGGMAEVITNNSNGKIVKTYDVNGIFEALSYLIKNYEDAISMAAKARETIEQKHTLQGQIKEYLLQYARLIK